VSASIEESGRGTATFEITESPKVKIIDVDFVGAKAFPVKKLRKVIKTRRHWMFSWITAQRRLQGRAVRRGQGEAHRLLSRQGLH
jgi:outer membrane protein assembly factor BamA